MRGTKCKIAAASILLLCGFLFSCTANDDKADIAVYPSAFVIFENEYHANHEWSIEHHGEYTLGDIIGYLIYVKDEKDFARAYPDMEYVAFDVMIGRRFEDHYDRVPIYELNEYKDRSFIAIYQFSYIYKKTEGK